MSTLPEKCCAKCGFLYGRAFDPANREDALFDPDLIRSEEYPPAYDGKPGFITSHPYVSQKYYDVVDDNSLRVTTKAAPPEVRSYCWRDTAALYCYLKKFDPISLKHKPIGGVTQEEENEILSHQISPSWFDVVKDTIQKDRQSCEGFFQYQPGYSTTEHIGLMLEEKRIKRAEEHEIKLAEWSAAQERRLIEWTNSQESRWQRFQAEREKGNFSSEVKWKTIELRLIVIFGILGLLFTSLQILAGFLIAKYYP